MNEKLDNLCALVFNKIKNDATKAKPITAQKIRADLGINRRDLQKILFELRKTYPIVAKETVPAGYYIATCEDDIIAFIQLLQNHINGHEETSRLMNNFIGDYGNIPFID